MQKPAQQEEEAARASKGHSDPQNWCFTRSALIPVSLEAAVSHTVGFSFFPNNKKKTPPTSKAPLLSVHQTGLYQGSIITMIFKATVSASTTSNEFWAAFRSPGVRMWSDAVNTHWMYFWMQLC